MISFSLSVEIAFAKLARMYDKLTGCFQKSFFNMSKKMKYLFSQAMPCKSFYFSLLSAPGAIVLIYWGTTV